MNREQSRRQLFFQRSRNLGASCRKMRPILSLNILPPISRKESREVPHIGGGNHSSRKIQSHGLGHQNHIGINRFITGGWLSLLPSLRPK